MITFLDLGRYGRLGNQLWQIASTIGIAIKNETDYSFPAWGYEQYFINSLPLISFREWKDYEEVNSSYQDIVLSDKFNWNLKGYFQSWKYFDHCKDLIRKQFEFVGTPNRGAVGVHVRRGDYVNLNHIHPVLDLKYYIQASRYFSPDRFDLYIFSDDISWCKENFTKRNFPRYNFVFSDGQSDIDDFFSLCNCEHHIIANSSFSWWAAYLNEAPNKIIIAPKNYVIGEERNDRIPPEWTKI